MGHPMTKAAAETATYADIRQVGAGSPETESLLVPNTLPATRVTGEPESEEDAQKRIAAQVARMQNKNPSAKGDEDADAKTEKEIRVRQVNDAAKTRADGSPAYEEMVGPKEPDPRGTRKTVVEKASAPATATTAAVDFLLASESAYLAKEPERAFTLFLRGMAALEVARAVAEQNQGSAVLSTSATPVENTVAGYASRSAALLDTLGLLSEAEAQIEQEEAAAYGELSSDDLLRLQGLTADTDETPPMSDEEAVFAALR